MVEKMKPEIADAVAETLLIPLYMRCLETKHPRAMFRDEKAVELVERLDYDFKKFDKGRMSAVGTAIRVRHFDRKVQAFIERRKEPIVVNVGCGLDTRYHRIERKRHAWFYEIDLPEVMRLRERLIPAGQKQIHLSASMLDTRWLDVLRSRHPEGDFIFVFEGVLMYFDETEVKSVLRALAERFHGSELHFDVISGLLSRQSHRHDTVKYMRARFQWGLDNERELETWAPNLTWVDTTLYMTQEKMRWGLLGLLLRRIPAFRKGSSMLQYQIE